MAVLSIFRGIRFGSGAKRWIRLVVYHATRCKHWYIRERLKERMSDDPHWMVNVYELSGNDEDQIHLGEGPS